MNDSFESTSKTVTSGEELVAYLDGELDSTTRMRVEEQLSTDAQLREKLKELQQTWDWLDQLPQENVDENFTRTTVEMVAIRAEEEVARRAQVTSRKRLAAIVLGIVCASVAGATGYLVTNSKLNEPNQQLIRDLPVLENLDAYQNAESIEFLRSLQKEGLFKEDLADDE